MWDTNRFKINFHLIRHGKTEANEKRLYYGFSDIPLNENGINEIISLKKTIVYPKGDIFFVSGLKRTIQTMELIFGKNKYIVNKNLKEMNFGDFELKSYEQLKNNKDYIKWIENIEQNVIPNGETKKQFEKRVIIGFSEIFNYCLKNNIRNVVVVCHSGVISILMQKLFTKIDKNFYDWLPSYARGYTITFGKSNNIYYKKI